MRHINHSTFHSTFIVYIVHKYNNTDKDKIKACFQQKIDFLYFTNYKTRDSVYSLNLDSEQNLPEELVQQFLEYYNNLNNSKGKAKVLQKVSEPKN